MSRNGTYKPNLCECKFNVNEDFARTIVDGAITPRQIAELTARGIPVTPQAVEREIQGNDSWYVDPLLNAVWIWLPLGNLNSVHKHRQDMLCSVKNILIL